MLRHHHGLGHGISQLAGGLLLQRRGSEGRCGHTLERLLAYRTNGKLGLAAALQECYSLFAGGKALVEFGFDLGDVAFGLGHGEDGAHAIVGLAHEGLYLALALNDESYSHALHASGRQCGLHLAPQYGRKLESHESVEHSSCLLGIDEVHVEMTGMLDGIKDGGGGNLVEYDAVGIVLVQAQHLTQMPTDGLSLAVFIGCQPHALCLLDLLLELAHQLAFLLGYLVIGLHRLLVDGERLLFQVTYVAET